MPTVVTVGHGARSAGAFLDVLASTGATTVLDIRRFPGSRRHPHFSRGVLAATLMSEGIGYEWWGEPLGGRRSRQASSRHVALHNAAFAGYADHMDSVAFRNAVRQLLCRADAGERLAVMCAETVWWRCHRSLVADAFHCQGADVRHAVDAAKHDRHRPRPVMRCGDDGWPVYDVPDTLPVDLP